MTDLNIRIGPLSHFTVRRSGAGVSLRCIGCSQLVRETFKMDALDVIVLDALKHECPPLPVGDPCR